MRLIAIALLFLGAVAGGEAAGPVRIALEPVVTHGLRNPVFVTHAGDGSARLFVVEQPGRIRIVANGTLAPAPFLDIAPRLLSGGERGLLGLAFHPDYPRNGRYFVNYTRRPDGATVIAEYRVSAEANLSAPAERVLLVIDQPYPNHNGGMIAFGADGFSTSAWATARRRRPADRAQNPQELPQDAAHRREQGSPYAVPADNPFGGGGARPEIWALGLRPRGAFPSTATHELWAGDVARTRG